MVNKNDKDAADYVRCVARLRRKEAKDGLRRDRKSGLIRDYSLPKYDGDPDAMEYRQLAAGRQKKGDDEDPVDPAENQRSLGTGTLWPWFKKDDGDEER